MGRLASSRAAAVWGRLVVRQERSGLSVAEFCRREDVAPASFYAWRKRLRENGEAGSQPLFVPVEMELTERSGSGGVQIELPGGAVVRLPAAASAELVQAAIRAAMHGPVRVATNAFLSEEASSC